MSKLRFSEYERASVETLREVLLIDDGHKPGEKVTRGGPAPADRLFCLLPADPANEGRDILTQRYEGGAVRLRAGDVVFIPRGLHYVDEYTASTKSLLIIGEFSPPPDGAITRWRFDGDPEIRRRFGDLLALWRRKKPGYYQRAMAAVYEILAALQKRERREGGETARLSLQPAVDRMRSGYAEKIAIPELAPLCGMSYPSFRARFGEVYGVSAREYLTGVRIAAARNLLEIGDFPIGEVARRCGFEDACYFSGFFKRVTGVSPEEYRAQSAGR